MNKKIILSGYGNVGKQFIKIFKDKKQYVKEKYGINLILAGIIGKNTCIFEYDGIDLELLLSLNNTLDPLCKYGEIKNESLYTYPIYEGNALIECNYEDMETGDPAFKDIVNAINSGMDIVILSKMALAKNFDTIVNLAKDRDVRLKYSGATASALPTMDLGNYSLAGCKINSIVGILNGTTNYILTKLMEDDLDFDSVLKDVIDKEITEADSDKDIKGIDSACKLVILANSFMKANCKLEDVEIKGIEEIQKEDIIKNKEIGKTIKLVSKAYYDEKGKIRLQVKPENIDKENILYNVRGSNKGIIFKTDIMGDVCAIGGKGNLKSIAAAALKDVINLYRV